jgi:hypothetical protein
MGSLACAGRRYGRDRRPSSFPREGLRFEGHIEEALKTAKATGHEKVSSLLGKSAPEMKWH